MRPGRTWPARFRIAEPAVQPARPAGLDGARDAASAARRPMCCSAASIPPTGLRGRACRRRCAGGADLVVASDHASAASLCADVAHVVLPIGVVCRDRRARTSMPKAAGRAGRRRGQAAGREPAGLEGAARARESAGPAGLRLRSARKRCAMRCSEPAATASALPSAAAAAACARRCRDGARRRRRRWVDIPPYQVRCAGARLRGARQDQGRAHDPWT